MSMFIVILPFWLWALLLPLSITFKLVVVGMRLLVAGIRLVRSTTCWLARAGSKRSAHRGDADAARTHH